MQQAPAKKSQKRHAADAAEEAAAAAAAEAKLMDREEEEENEISFHILCFQVSPAHILFRRNIGGYGPVYEQLREADPTQEIKVIQKLRSSQAHCVQSHQGRLAEIIRSLFIDTEDELTKTVKNLCLMSMMERQSSLLTIL